MTSNECFWCGKDHIDKLNFDPRDVFVDTKTNKQIKALVCNGCWDKHKQTDIDSNEFINQLSIYAKKHYQISDPEWLCFRN